MRHAVYDQTDIGTDLGVAAAWLRRGEPVAIPTETVYGLAANALDPAAAARIFEVKNRPTFDPLIVHVGSLEAVERYALSFPPAAQALAAQFWPGPLTLLLPKRPEIPDLVTAGLPRVALRWPAHPVAQALLQSLAFPLAAPSANPFGYVSPTTAQHVHDQLHGRIPYILDGGPCSVGVESTIVGFEGDETIVYRLGGLPLEALEAVAGPLRVQLNQSSNPAAPGMLSSHYAPRKPLFLIEPGAPLPDTHPMPVGLIALKPRTDLPPGVLAIPLSDDGDLSTAAQRLFGALRQFDQTVVTAIYAERCPEVGLGRAINDRLRRAAF